MRHIFHIIFVATATAATQLPCGSDSQVLFQSNAYYSEFSFLSSYQGGSVLETTEKWNGFVESFFPENYGDSLARTSIDFSTEKVVIGTYFTTSTCMIDISHAELECEASNGGSLVQMKMIMDVFDASLNCEIVCGALGQVVYAVAVPLAWEIDEDAGFQINVVGPCGKSVSSSSASQSAEINVPPEAIMVDTETTAVTTTTTQPTDESSSTSSTIITTAPPKTESPQTGSSILLGTQTTAAPVSFEEFGIHSNDSTSSDAPETTLPPSATAEEQALLEQQQLRGTAPPNIVEDVTIPAEEQSETADSNASMQIQLDTTTTTPAPQTDTTTSSSAATTTKSTAISAEPAIALATSPDDPVNAQSSSGSNRQQHIISFMLLMISIFV